MSVAPPNMHGVAWYDLVENDFKIVLFNTEREVIHYVEEEIGVSYGGETGFPDGRDLIKVYTDSTGDVFPKGEGPNYLNEKEVLG